MGVESYGLFHVVDRPKTGSGQEFMRFLYYFQTGGCWETTNKVLIGDKAIPERVHNLGQYTGYIQYIRIC